MLLDDKYFKILIAWALPCSWDAFTQSYVGGEFGGQQMDPQKVVSLLKFIGYI